MANDESSTPATPVTRAPDAKPNPTQKGRAGRLAPAARRPSASHPKLAGTHEYGLEWQHSEAAALVAVNQALTHYDDKALQALQDKARDPGAFIERLRLCAGVLARPLVMRPLLDGRAHVFERTRAWLLPIVTPAGQPMPPFTPDAQWLQAVQACVQDWVGPQHRVAMLPGIAGWGDLVRVTPGQWRRIVDSLALHARGEGPRPGVRRVEPLDQASSELTYPRVSFLLGVLSRDGPTPRFPSANDAKAACARSRLEGLLEWVSRERDGVGQGRGQGTGTPMHRISLPMPFTLAFEATLGMWLQEVQASFEILAWDLCLKRSMSLSLVMQLRSKVDVEQETRLQMGLLRWQVGEGGLQRLQERLSTEHRVHGLELVPNDKGVALVGGRVQ